MRRRLSVWVPGRDLFEGKSKDEEPKSPDKGFAGTFKWGRFKGRVQSSNHLEISWGGAKGGGLTVYQLMREMRGEWVT